MTFIDIETVPETIECKSELFEKKFKKDIDSLESILMNSSAINPTKEALKQLWHERASFHAEFGKIVCVSLGIITADKIRIKTLYNRNEKELLKQLSEILLKTKSACAHNGLEFDFPFLMRRFIINGLPIPELLQMAGKKPWELQLEDTMKMWSGSAWNYRVSLELLAHVLGLESPKSEMNGSQVAELYYAEPAKDQLPFDVEEVAKTKISAYCSKDVITLANCHQRMKGLPIISQVEIVAEQPNLFS